MKPTSSRARAKASPTGAMIEILSGSPKPNLLLWNGRKATIAPRAEHRDSIYEAIALSPGLYTGPCACLLSAPTTVQRATCLTD